MRNTITQCWDAHIYNSSDQTLPPPIKTVDFMMRAGSDAPSPIISLNNQLPEILLCISRELATLQREKSLCGKYPRLDTHMKAAPLVIWYKSILGNTYTDYPIHMSNDQHAGQILSSFSLRGEIYQPTVSYFRLPSQFYYVALSLPPLWQKRKTPPVSSEEITASRIFAFNQPHDSNRCFSFRYCSVTGFWYAAVMKDPVRRFNLNELGN